METSSLCISITAKIFAVATKIFVNLLKILSRFTDHSYDHNHVGAEPESEPSAESEPEPDSGATAATATSLATLAAMLLAAVLM